MQENNQDKNLVLIEDLGMICPNEKLKYKARMGIYKCHCGKEFETVSIHGNPARQLWQSEPSDSNACGTAGGSILIFDLLVRRGEPDGKPVCNFRNSAWRSHALVGAGL